MKTSKVGWLPIASLWTVLPWVAPSAQTQKRPAAAEATPLPARASSATAATPSAAPVANPDWANLNRYRVDNAALAPAAGGEKRVVFYGDSITDAWGRRPDTGEFFPGRPYINRGISGQTTPQMLVRFQQDVVHLQPAVVVILAGTNDVAGNTGPTTNVMVEDNYASMAALARANGIKVVLASVTPVYHYPWRPGLEPVARIRDLNLWLKAFCAREGCVYLDYYSAMVDEKGAMLPGYSSDGVHPLAKGYAVMAPLAEQAIAEALK